MESAGLKRVRGMDLDGGGSRGWKQVSKWSESIRRDRGAAVKNTKVAATNRVTRNGDMQIDGICIRLPFYGVRPAGGKKVY